MINKKVLTILIMSLMFTLLVGCSSVKEYSYDYNKISEISTISLAISDAYNNSSRKSDFKKESKKIIKDLQKTKMKTKEGKDVLKAYGKISKAMRELILANWNKNKLNASAKRKLLKLSENLKDKLEKFEEKIEELPTLYSVDLLNMDTCRNDLLKEDIRQYGREI